MDELQAAADIAQCLADPTRLRMLQFLTWGPASVAELVSMTGATQPNVSNHLKLLRERGVLSARKEGRQTIYRVRSAAMAEVIGALSWAAIGHAGPSGLRTSGGLSEGRACYDHLAGRLGVGLLRGLAATKAIIMVGSGWSDVRLGPEAGTIFARLGIEPLPDMEQSSRRRMAFECPDWSEHGKAHLGGFLGKLLLDQLLQGGWLFKEDRSRAISLTGKGRIELTWLLTNH